jgi:putative nucleotidyltransferase with HDIG domain
VQQVNQLRHLSDLAREVAPIQGATDLRDLYAALARSVRQTLNVDGCLVSVWDRERNALVDMAASVMPPYRLNTLTQQFSLTDFPAMSEVLKKGKSLEVSVSDPEAHPAEIEFLRQMKVRRALYCRMMADGEVIGTVESYRIEDRPFRKDDFRQVDLLVGFAASAYSRIKLAERLEGHYMTTIEAMVNALEARDPGTVSHTGRIRDLAVSLAVAIKLPAELRHAIKLGALLHDVGKIGISDSILGKPGALTDAEWVQMRCHPEIGVRMLQGIEFLQPSVPIIRHHHEFWNGAGYPDGLAGEDIPIGARIVSVCDAYDAMTSDRAYRKAMSRDDACAEIDRGAGTQFDPGCARLLVKLIQSMGEVDNLEERFVRYAN